MTHSPTSGPVRAGIVVTGTEVLTGRVADANGPWLAEQLRTLGVDVGRVVVVGDRPDDLESALRYLLADHRLVITTGGLGPTADDLTAEVVARVQGRALQLDDALERRVAARVEELNRRRERQPAPEVVAAGVRKQAMVPQGAAVLEPVGTAPGLVVTAADDGTAPVLVLPGPPGELRPMWDDALREPAVLRAIEGAGALRQATLRAYGPPESELAALLREHETAHGSLDEAGLEVTTCLREGELEVVTRYRPDAQHSYDRLVETLHEGFGAALYSREGATVDETVAALFREGGATVATAESCTAGLLAGRLADVPGSSAYLLGGFVTYANAAKTAEVGVPAELIERVGAVSAEVADAMARGARERLGTTLGVGITGVAGPGGGTPDKPVGLVHVCLAHEDGRTWPLRLQLGGGRAGVRQRTVVACLHLLREVLTRS